MREAYPHVIMIAEDSTEWPQVTGAVEEGGLGFHYKWNMGWMNDVLKYMETPPEERRHCHQLISFHYYMRLVNILYCRFLMMKSYTEKITS